MKKYGLIAIFLLALCSCSEDVLEKTIFIPDENDSNLPAYTEWGYNAFGAKYERSYFLAANDIIPCKIVYRNGILLFSLSGYTGTGYYNDERMTLTFSFPISSPIREYSDLTALHNLEIDLTDASCEVKMEKDNQEEIINLLSGQLFFKRTQLLRIDGKENRVILSGLFEVSFLNNGIPERISDGRFDLGINKDFYSFVE
ncbi:MAG: hypothetical protein LBS08_03460 [Candidatus Symbiothrix sp.]|jgi:hypothetical protein|nr:hypothetical protein [Candidatus Symbiothrix sp.]